MTIKLVKIWVLPFSGGHHIAFLGIEIQVFLQAVYTMNVTV